MKIIDFKTKLNLVLQVRTTYQDLDVPKSIPCGEKTSLKVAIVKSDLVNPLFAT